MPGHEAPEPSAKHLEHRSGLSLLPFTEALKQFT